MIIWMIFNIGSVQWLSERAISAAKNMDVNAIDINIQNVLPGLPPYIINLKFGIPIILLKNINSIIFCVFNLTRLVVKNLLNNIIDATI